MEIKVKIYNGNGQQVKKAYMKQTNVKLLISQKQKRKKVVENKKARGN
jgi:hypothetical protein